tara:strand:- start:162 stop:353 length:192 start_codon:yes stop_codon:yes gene_type:complete
MDATSIKKTAIQEAERWRRAVISYNTKKLAKPDILEKTKVRVYKESTYYTASTASTTISTYPH